MNLNYFYKIENIGMFVFKIYCMFFSTSIIVDIDVN